jgi:hypothetical protein
MLLLIISKVVALWQPLNLVNAGTYITPGL